ncbi:MULTISPECIES: putative 2-aminoethylphosphonate ABC transporter substrate-binding protein [unclassified Endozoicomonas]|uniref:putative 2-aminoethylphosphonate ABC transporter substrate-binding protein n=1 Tax=unclassified Endozoicomonas TaxID=2644528 RepID=UPI0021471EEB|nr:MULTISPECIES: putative 2-aminoethylphosphonate ABC transporter substrate-binding protein [unclassified Endozoicomonas]
MKKHLTALTLAVTSIFSASSFAASPVELTVYTAFETDLLNRYKKAFEQENPDVSIKWVRDSTGIMTAKLLAEKNNSRADVVWGLAGSSMALLKDAGVLDTYTPKGLDEIKAQLVDPEAAKAWFGNQAYFNVICYNEAVAKAKNLPKPQSWQDLLDPVYQGQIAMPNPASSGTGYMQVSAWLQSMGQDKGWAYMDKLNNNMAQYTHSGSKPCVQAAMGEVAIGISMAVRGAQLKSQGAPLDLILPKGGIGWDVESVGLVAGTDQAAAAKKLIDWSLSQQANEQYVEAYPVVGHKDVSKKVPNYPDVESAMVDMDFGEMASERETVLAEWSKRFDHMSEPKS